MGIRKGKPEATFNPAQMPEYPSQCSINRMKPMTCQSNFVTRMSTIEKGEYFSVANSWCSSDTAHIIGDKKSSFFPMRAHQ